MSVIAAVRCDREDLARVLGERWAVTGADNDAGAMKRATSLALREGVAKTYASFLAETAASALRS